MALFGTIAVAARHGYDRFRRGGEARVQVQVSRSLCLGVRTRFANNPVYGSADLIWQAATTFFHPMINALDYRTPEHPIETLFAARWSPRAMSGDPLTDEEIRTLFEAARWAPSTYNEQEWRFLYARRDTPQWPLFFELLVEGNQAWCKNAALLCVILAHKVFTKNGKPNPVHLFDCGSAFENLALQGTVMGLVVHGMMGFDFDKARTALNVPDDYAVAAMFAAGRPGELERLPDNLRERETPSDRKPIDEIICEGKFTFGGST